ncbi:hypothetical protein K440DRAFT_33181 [Wilcoxina mikolae CBS 423.85]|nr:hypothetical protein K440DRAFT_33181 [Wilcoxina mikolae CBS 423.85]
MMWFTLCILAHSAGVTTLSLALQVNRSVQHHFNATAASWDRYPSFCTDYTHNTNHTLSQQPAHPHHLQPPSNLRIPRLQLHRHLLPLRTPLHQPLQPPPLPPMLLQLPRQPLWHLIPLQPRNNQQIPRMHLPHLRHHPCRIWVSIRGGDIFYLLPDTEIEFKCFDRRRNFIYQFPTACVRGDDVPEVGFCFGG